MAQTFNDFLDIDKSYIDVSNKIFSYQDEAVLCKLLSTFPSDPAVGPRIDWKGYDVPSYYTQVNNGGGYTASDTDIVVDNASIAKVGYTIFVPRTSEIMRITAINTSTNTWTVTRGFAGTTAAALNDNDDLYVIGSTEKETDSGQEHTASSSEAYNYAQLFEHQFIITDTVANTKFRHNAVKRDLKEVFKTHRTEIERALLFGQRYYDTSNGIYSVGGINSWIPADNITTKATSAFDMDAWEEFLIEKAFAQGSTEKYLFAGSKFFRYLAGLYDGLVRYTVNDDRLGMRVVELLSPDGGILKVVRHKLMVAQTAYWAFVVDPENVRYRPLIKSHMEKLAKTGNGRKWLIQTQASLEVHGAYTHAKIVLTT